MVRRSAGVLVYRRREGRVEVLLVHPGGPLWARKDLGAWSIPKGEYDAREDALSAAVREFEEETGSAISGEFVPLGDFRQPSGKFVSAFAVEGDFDVARLKSNTFEMQWPPRSGKIGVFPEVDRAAWFPIPEAKERITAGQRPLLATLFRLLNNGAPQ